MNVNNMAELTLYWRRIFIKCLNSKIKEKIERMGEQEKNQEKNFQITKPIRFVNYKKLHQII